jgi:hypothetical protein
MTIIRNILLGIVGIVISFGLLFWLGLHVQPQSFPAYLEQTSQLDTVPLPSGLPLPVERFYQTVYGNN